MIQPLFNSLDQRGITRGSALTKLLLVQIFDAAAGERLISSNPMNSVHVLQYETNKGTALSYKEEAEFLEKLKSNMKEVEARKGELYVFADADTGIEPTEHIHVIRLPENYGPLSPILHVVPLQLLAYHTAFVRGNDVDKPRNLAKSVTTE